ncbi:hypothetical protein D6C89_02697 [Aureobasidium pullulans]|nr:hypothetical protein D6C89_02697 [Aureobasidium pullulans]
MSHQALSHASSKTPIGLYLPRQERLDLARMSKSDLVGGATYHCAHLTFLECKGESVFPDAICVNLVLNALRIHWKVSGRVLRTLADQGNDLMEFLTLEVDNKRVIADLFTEEARHYLLERDGSDALIIFTTVIHDIYAATWYRWSKEFNSKHLQAGQFALIIAHAQAISNQLSNNVLAFKDKAAPELKRWAEETASCHLMAIVTLGHLPSRHVAPAFVSSNDSSAPDLMGAKYNANNINTKGYYPTHSGPVDHHYRAPIPNRPSFSTKRKAPAEAAYSCSTPPSKKFRGKTESPEKRRVYDTYRPSGPRRPTLYNNDHRSAPRNPYTSQRHHDRYKQALDHDELRKERLRVLDQKIAQHPPASRFSDEPVRPESSGSSQGNAPVVDGPSYVEYLRSREGDNEPITGDINLLWGGLFHRHGGAFLHPIKRHKVIGFYAIVH